MNVEKNKERLAAQILGLVRIANGRVTPTEQETHLIEDLVDTLLETAVEMAREDCRHYNAAWHTDDNY